MSMALVGQKRNRVPTLMELAQNESKYRIRESLRDAIWECEKMSLSVFVYVSMSMPVRVCVSRGESQEGASVSV